MIRFLLSCMAFCGLAGCLSWPVASRDGAARSSAAAASIGQYHFAWKLSGNRAVAPLQVFDDGRQTWLQFPPGQPVPAVFARLPQGDQLLVPTTGAGGLVMLDGVWPQLVIRGGALQSVAQRLPTDQTAAAPAAVPAATPVPPPPAPAPPAAVPVPSAAPVPPAVSVPPTASAAAIPAHPTAALPPAAVSAPNVEVPPAPPVPVFQVSPADGTLRAALAHWANTVGWTFAFEHWAVEVDIPIVAAAAFPLPFEDAVQELVASTVLSDQPLRPCFYSNQVLRIVAHTQPCDRSAVGGR